MPEDDNKSCRYCGGQIVIGTTVCPICHRHQSAFRNALPVLVSTVAILAFLTSPFTYIGTEVYKWYQSLTTGDRLWVSSFLEHGKATIHNVGYRPLFVVRVEIEDRSFGRSMLYDVYKRVREGEVIRFEVGKKKVAYLVPVKPPFKKYREEIEERARSGSMSGVFPIITTPSDPDYRFRKRALIGAWPKEFRCEATVVFVPAGDTREITQQFQCISMIYAADLEKLLCHLESADETREKGVLTNEKKGSSDYSGDSIADCGDGTSGD